MTRRAKNQAVPQQQPPETERERLIRNGMAIELAWSQEGRTPTREEIESARQDVAHFRLADFPEEKLQRLMALGKLDPMPLLAQVKRVCLELLQQSATEKRQAVVERLLVPLSDVELVLALRRGGRRKGARHKVTPAQVEAVRRWLRGRRRRRSLTVDDLAEKLGLSRQTIYTLMKEIEAESGGP
jgi:DNA-binding transcriptional ArsR family regulator